MKNKKVILGSLAVLTLAVLIVAVLFVFNIFSNNNKDPDITTPPSGGGVDNTPVVPGYDVEGYVLLAGLSQPDPNEPAQSPKLPDRSYFRPTSGEFRDVSGLTAWDDNAQILIGSTDAATGAPILLDSSSLSSGSWLSAQTAGVFNAAGFQLTFSTSGYENIRFTAHQTVSDDFGGGEGTEIPFELAFSTSGGVRWTAIHDSAVNVQRNGGTFEAINEWPSRTYNDFSLPGVIGDEDEVILRIYLNSVANLSKSGSMSINNIRIIGDKIGGGDKGVVLMELTEEASNASAIFSATPEDAFYGATVGLSDSDFRLTGWDRGRPRFIGYTGEVQTPVVFENIMTTRSWTAAQGDIENATAFQIQLRTSGYEDIVFSAAQISSVGGPDIFKLAYSLCGEIWVEVADSTRSILQSSDKGFETLALSYDKFLLPAEFSSRESVFLRIYFDGSSTGESTSINNIEIWGRPLVSYDGFSARMLTIQPGRTTAERNITWHDWTMTGDEGKVMYEPAATAANGFTQAAQTVDAASVGAYIRKLSHMATITGLEPDTEYVYAVSSDGTNFSELYTFKTSQTDSFSFIAISDVHMGDPSVSPFDDDSGNNGKLDDKYRPGVTVKQGWQDALDAMLATVPGVSFLALMGDMVDRNLFDADAEADLQPHRIKWENYLAPRQLSGIPIAPVMGNHEARSNISFRIHYNLPNEIIPAKDALLPTASTGIQNENENMANYWYLYNNALFVVINTTARPRDANENATQDAIIEGLIAYLDDIIQMAKDAHEGEYDWLFVQTHKSITGIGKHSADFDVERFVRMGLEALMVKHAVDVVFTAHEHSYTRSFPLARNPGPDNFLPDIVRSEFRMNNISYDYTNGGSAIKKGDGPVIFSLNTISGQKFYAPYAPEFFNNVNYPYLYDGTRGALNMSVPPGDNIFLSPDIETFGPKLPWSVANYRQEYKPIFLELTVTASSVVITAYEFAHDLEGTLLEVTVVDNLTISK
ncbi:MAG: metallophosphoesterase family protein [Oscillospiraceae bacterium]|nr:metallophosphoesterase family protein [Oscillospiraceae bacterium]